VRLVQAVKLAIVVIAVLFGFTANALAHAGHVHAQSPTVVTIEYDSRTAVPQQFAAKITSTIALSSLSSSVHPKMRSDGNTSANAAPAHKGVTACPPGSGCCLGVSSCGVAGHCCPSMMLEPAEWTHDLCNRTRYHWARSGWLYLDIVIGFDRPPKA